MKFAGAALLVGLALAALCSANVADARVLLTKASPSTLVDSPVSLSDDLGEVSLATPLESASSSDGVASGSPADLVIPSTCSIQLGEDGAETAIEDVPEAATSYVVTTTSIASRNKIIASLKRTLASSEYDVTLSLVSIPVFIANLTREGVALTCATTLSAGQTITIERNGSTSVIEAASAPRKG